MVTSSARRGHEAWTRLHLDSVASISGVWGMRTVGIESMQKLTLALDLGICEDVFLLGTSTMILVLGYVVVTGLSDMSLDPRLLQLIYPLY